MAENKDKKVLNVPNKRELIPNTFDTAEHKEVRLKRNVPNLRFKEFEGEWKECRLGEITQNFNLRNKEKRQYPMFSVTNDRGFVPQSEQFEGRDMIGDDIKAYKIIHSQEFAYNPARINVGSIAMYSDKDPCMISSLYVCFKTTKEVNNEWLMQLLKTPKLNYYYNINGEGGVRVYLFYPNFARIRMFLPPIIDEQNKIATFLSLLDERIATQNKIIDKLESLIKGLNQQLLYNNKWKTYKIKDIADIGRGRVISSIEIEKQHQPKYPVYSSQTSNNGIMGYLDDYMFDGEYITWTTDGANAGTVFYRNGKFNCTNVCGTLKINQEHNCYFVSLVLQQSTHYYVSTNLANPKLMNNTMASIKIKLPNIEEQNYLSKIFFLLNEHLYTNIRINKFYLEQKQYLLRQMFI